MQQLIEIVLEGIHFVSNTTCDIFSLVSEKNNQTLLEELLASVVCSVYENVTPLWSVKTQDVIILTSAGTMVTVHSISMYPVSKGEI